MSVRVEAVPAATTHDLRERVLRRGTPSTDVAFPHDDDPTTVHLAVVDGDAVLALASFYVARPPFDDPRPARQLRGMAVDPARQREGLGELLLGAAVERWRSEGVELLWANARDSALGFYERLGWRVVGEGFVSAETALPHHVVALDL